jgi:uncharacterized protein Veg
MKGNKIKEIAEYIKSNQGKEVYIEFSFYSITMDGSEIEWEETVDRLREEYPDGVFIIGNDGFISTNNADMRINKYHNLIDGVYEWIE